MQTLRTAQYSGQRLDRRPHDIVLWLQRCQRGASRLSVEAHHPAPRIFCPEVIPHNPSPHPARRPELGYFLQQIAVRVEEKAQPRRKRIHVHACVDCCLNIGHPIGQRERDFLHRRRTCLPHMVSGDGNRIPLRHLHRSPCEGVRHQAHRMFDRIDISPAGNILLQNVVLDRSGQFANVRFRSLRHRDIQSQQDRSCGVDRHGSRHAV